MPHELLLDRPPGFDRIQDWFGCWSIHEPAADGLVQQFRTFNLSLHLQQSQGTVACGGPDEIQAVVDYSSEADTRRYAVVDGVALVRVSGTMMKHRTSMGGGASTVEARLAVRAAVKDPRVEALLLVLDTPGGTVAGSGDLADDVAIAAAAKPTWAYIEDLGASAGYLVASQASRIHINRGGAAGSIGVFTVVYDLSGMAEADRVKVHVIKAGEFKGSGVPGSAVTEKQLAEWQRIVDGFYQQFVDAVSVGRRLERSAVLQLADGRVHVGAEAVRLKLVDRVASLDETLTELRQFVAQSKFPKKGSPKMSTETSAAPQAATLPELKAACPGASSDFLVSQLEAGATVAVASKAWMAKMQQDLAAKDAAIKAEQEKAAAAEQRAREAEAKAAAVPAKPAGVTPPNSAERTVEEEFSGSAAEQFHAAVEDHLQKHPKTDRMTAVQTIALRQPRLHAAFLLETNPGAKNRRILNEKLESNS